MDALPRIERTVDIDAPPHEVWRRIVDGTVADEWLGIEIEPRVGGAVSIPGREMIGAVEEIVDGTSITWAWRELDGEPSQVTVTVTERGAHSTVIVTERLLGYEITDVEPTWVRRRWGPWFSTSMAA